MVRRAALSKFTIAFFAAAFCLTLSLPTKAQEEGAAYKYDSRFVERITFLNENGVISIDYEEPWWFEVYQYAQSLENAIYTQLDAANSECEAITAILEKDTGMRTGAHFGRVVQSMSVNGTIEPAMLLSSLLKKFTHKSPVDAENAESWGKYRPLSGECDSTSAVRSGMILQMFPNMSDAPVPLQSSFCPRVAATMACLENVQALAAKNDRADGAQVEGSVDLKMDTVFSVVSGDVD